MAKEKFTEFDDSYEDPTAKIEEDKGSEESGEKGAESGKEEENAESDESENAADDSGTGDGEESKSGSEGDDGSEGSEDGEKSGEKEKDDSETKDEGEGDKGADSGKEDGDDKGAESEESGKDADDDSETRKDADGDGSEDDDKDKAGEESEEDFFAASDEEAGDKGDENTISYKPIAEEFDIELENDSKEELVKKVRETIKASKQELNLDDYSEQARSLIKHLNENKGDIGKFLTNTTINEMQGILNMEPEDKVRMVRINEMVKEGKTEDAAVEAYNEELTNLTVSDIRKMSDSIDKQATTLRDQEVTKITGDKEAQLKEQRKAADLQFEQEVEILKNYINAQDEFLGLKLSQKAKAQILADLETGNFDNVVEKSPEASKFFAYMTGKFGPKIIENFSKSKSEANREGYNKATDKSTGALHNDKKSAAGKAASGHQKGEEGEKKNFSTWEDDLFSGPDQ
jgi:hypothetical protein